MKPLVTLCASAIAGVLVLPTGAIGQPSPGDSVTGEARDCVQVLSNGLCELHSARIDAHSGPSGGNPTGTIRYGFSFGTPGSSGFGEGTVTCLSVTGNVATIGFTGSEFDEFLDVFVTGFVTVIDAGGRDSQLDRFGVHLTWADPSEPRPGPTDCSGPVGSSPFENDEGDLTVVDAPALPTSKDQCKNGAWREFGVFKNRGDCVSFVATGGKNSPAGHP